MNYERLLLVLIVAAVITYIVHRRRRTREMGDIVLNAYCYSVVNSVAPPDTIPRMGVNAFKRVMKHNYPKAKIETHADHLVVSYTYSDRKTIIRFV